ncbi:M56 family metallopeptidase [Hyphomonas sp. UBA2515]|jgi:beta-lactamase regulating signal transducer with metallopeptidase domain|uniref:M56 family metallopeptidase n=1 Tax=Hyphomonas sp. UBA2515 TaxID=1946618 RepID=UPI0025C28995|nr:M56 family metallopeptidase [Hyphomonas sp. UBA2515]
MIFDLNSLNFTYGVQTVIAVSVLIALILFARKHVARQFGAGVAYALWAIPLARLVLPPLSMPTPLAGFFEMFQSQSPAAAGTADAAPAFVRSPEPVGSAANAVWAPPTTGPEASSPLFEVAHGPAAFPELSEPVLGGLLLGTVLAVWAGGAIYMLARSSFAHHSFMQTLRREEMPASPELASLADDVARQIGLKRTPQISTSFISSGPLVSGLLRPTVLLPAWFEEDYTVSQQRAALAHELTHIKRGDLWALQMSEIFVSALWFNPLAYIARRAFRTDQEAACDSDVLKSGASSPHAYGETLLKAVQLALPERLTAAASLPLTHALKERMIRMTTPSPSRSRRLLGAGVSGLLGSAALMSSAFVATACASAEADEKVDMAELAGGEPDNINPVPQHRSLHFKDGTLFIDGDKVEDRQVVIIGDPFSVDAMTPELEREIEILTSKIEAETAEIETLVASMPHIELAFEGFDEELNRKMEMAFSFTDETMPKSEAEWEAWAEKVEAQAEEWEAHAEAIAERAEAHADAWETRFEPQMDALEARIEAHADALERKIEIAYGEEFEDEMEHTHIVLTDLVEQCRDANLAEGETRILEKSSSQDKTRDVKIACIKGDKDTLKAKATIKSVMKSDKLDAAEKKAFKKQVNGSSSHTITIETDTTDE